MKYNVDISNLKEQMKMLNFLGVNDIMDELICYVILPMSLSKEFLNL
jgi:hypothetical protein